MLDRALLLGLAREEAGKNLAQAGTCKTANYGLLSALPAHRRANISQCLSSSEQEHLVGKGFENVERATSCRMTFFGRRGAEASRWGSAILAPCQNTYQLSSKRRAFNEPW